MTIKICMGSTCVMMGSMSIQAQLEELKSALGWEALELEFVKCMNYCKGSDQSSPVVVLDGEVILGATSEIVMEKIMAVYHAQQDGHDQSAQPDRV